MTDTPAEKEPEIPAETVDFMPYADEKRTADMAKYHKVKRLYLGVANPDIDALVKTWRANDTLDERIARADALWATDVHECRIAAAKLLTQARIRPDDAVWETLQSWLPTFDAWAIADHAATAMQKRLIADPSRLDIVETWTTSEHMWTRRAALIATLPWAKMNNPKPEEAAARERILGWAASYVTDRAWFMQKSIGWWLRDLSKRDPERVAGFLAEHGAAMKPFAVKEASKYLPKTDDDA